jgi:hypothetical protein
MTKRDGYLGLRLTTAEREALDECAEREQRSVSDTARLLIAEALEGRRLADSVAQDGRGPRTAPLGRAGQAKARETERTPEHKPDYDENLRCKTCGVAKGRHP